MSTITNITLPPSPPPQAQSPLNNTPDQLCYVHCTRCDTVLAVSVPCTSLFKTVTVRCGHCTNLLPVNMRGLMLPSSPAVNQFHFGPSLFSPSTHAFQDDWITNGNSNFSTNQNYPKDVSISSSRGFDDLPKPPVIHRAPEKRQRVPSAYNRFIKEEIQRIKIRNPEISHREAFSAAAKNWAHFPHIHFGLMADHQTAAAVNRTSMRQQETDGGVMKENSPYRALLQENDGGVMKENLFAAANVGVSPYNY